MVAAKNERPLVFILNTSIELIEALEAAFRMEGYDTIQEVVTHIKRGKTTLKKLLKGKKPDVLVYDVGLPYKENWEFLQHVRISPELMETCVLVTTTNKDALERIIKEDSQAFEITGVIGKPFDLDNLLVAVADTIKDAELQQKLKEKQNLHKSQPQ